MSWGGINTEIFFCYPYFYFILVVVHTNDMIRELLGSLEDPKRPLLGRNYWSLAKMGLILPKTPFNRILYLILHMLVSLFVITQYVELYIIRSDLDLVITNLRISMLSIVCIVKTNTFIFWQIKWKNVLEYITEADKYERNTNNKTQNRIFHAYSRYCRRVTLFYWALVFTTFVTVSITPLIRCLPSEHYRASVSNGTELFPHIFSSWVPFDKQTSPGSWIMVSMHVALAAYGAGIMASYDSTVIVIMVFFGGKLDLLRERCKHIFGYHGLRVSEQQAEKKIRELHSLHVLLMKYLKLFNSLLSPVMFLYVVMCSLMLCASAFQFTSATNATQKFMMAEYLIFGVAQLFMFCWHSNDVLVKGEKVSNGPYESEWWAVTPKQRKNIVILAGQLRLVHTFTAGPFTQFTLSTFIGILKGAYSYYTLLRR